MSSALPVYLRPKDAAARIGVSRTTLYRWAKGGLITLHKRGRMTFVRMSDIERVIEGLGDQMEDRKA